MIQEKALSKTGITRKSLIQTLSVLLTLSVIVFFVLLFKAWMDGKFNSIESLQDYISGFGVWGPVILTLVQAIQVVLPVLPGFLGCAVGGVLYGALGGFLCNYIGISLGSIAAFQLARKYGAPLVQEMFPGERYRRWAERAAESRSYAAFLLLATLLPLFPDDFLCYFTGLTKMTYRRFVMIIVIGKPWCILAYCLGFSLIK